MRLLRAHPGFTYADILRRHEEEALEVLDGACVARSPAPSVSHQRVVTELGRQIANFLDDRPGEVFVAPFDVRLAPVGTPPEAITTVVQPDIVVVCDPSGLDERGFQGTPDWIIEVTSPSTAERDQITKLALYEAHGVPCYWLVHPIDRIVTVYTLCDGAYGRPAIHPAVGTLPSGVFDELVIDWDHLPSPQATGERSPRDRPCSS